MIDWEQVRRISLRVARSLMGTAFASLDHDDLAQVGVMAVWKKWPDPEGVDAAPVLISVICRREQIDALRRFRNTRTVAPPRPYDFSINHDEMRELNLPAPVRPTEEWLDLLAALEQIDPRRRMVVMRCAEDGGMHELIQEMGVTDSRISQLRRQGREQLRKLLTIPQRELVA